MPVSDQHKQYANNIRKWQLIRDCDEGSGAIKSRSTGGTAGTLNGTRGTAYLPAPNATDTSDENEQRYIAYRDRANFVNFLGHTKEGMLGMVFRKETRIELAPDIKYLKENANGGGLSSDQMIKDVCGDTLALGRYGLLTDYPEAPQGLTEAQVSALNLQANILSYPAESIINWRTVMVGGVKKLSLVVLREPTAKVSADGFGVEEVTYHRVLLLKEIDGKLTYVTNMYDEDGNLIQWETEETDENGDPIYSGDNIPRKYNSKTWDEIPFAFIGATNNDESVDKAPLYDIAEINIAHYRNSADYEESSFLVGQPTPVVTGLTQSWVDQNMKGGVQLGSRGAILTPEGGNATLLQANENQMPLKGMEIKEKQMISIGARLIQDQGGVETAEAARIRFAGSNSKLGSIIVNVEAAFYKCYLWAMEFMGGTQEPEIEINKDLYQATLDPQLIMASIQLMDRAVIAKSDLQHILRRGGMIRDDRTDEDIDGEAEEVEIL
jgi:hypothetical protein